MSHGNIYLKQAKDRLAKNNYHEVLEQERIRRITQNVGSLEQWDIVELYAKVAQMEASDEVVMNPLALLVDEDKFCHLKDNEKELYILRLAAIYVELKKRYHEGH